MNLVWIGRGVAGLDCWLLSWGRAAEFCGNFFGSFGSPVGIFGLGGAGGGQGCRQFLIFENFSLRGSALGRQIFIELGAFLLAGGGSSRYVSFVDWGGISWCHCRFSSGILARGSRFSVKVINHFF